MHTQRPTYICSSEKQLLHIPISGKWNFLKNNDLKGFRWACPSCPPHLGLALASGTCPKAWFYGRCRLYNRMLRWRLSQNPNANAGLTKRSWRALSLKQWTLQTSYSCTNSQALQISTEECHQIWAESCLKDTSTAAHTGVVGISPRVHSQSRKQNHFLRGNPDPGKNVIIRHWCSEAPRPFCW